MSDPFFQPTLSRRPNGNFGTGTGTGTGLRGLGSDVLMTPADHTARLRKPSFRPSIVPPQTTNSNRVSMAPSSRLSMLPQQSALPLQSLASSSIVPNRGPGPVPTPMRSARKSMAPGMPSMNSLNTQVSTTRDPRPLRDKSFQNHMILQVQEYLVSNNFEIEMKHPFSPKTLRSPTQKDFVLIFQWLYHRLDPGYRFTKSIDNEVYSLLRIIGYPYFDSINKSQLAAVGGQTWFTILGMLFWMVELNQTLERYDHGQETGEKTDEDVLNDILERYSSNCYRAYLQNEHDFSEYRNETEREIEQFSQSMRNSITEAEGEIKDVRKRFEQLSREGDSMTLLERKRAALESDLIKFREYVDNLERRKDKWTGALDIIHEELAEVNQQYEDLQRENNELQEQLRNRGISPLDIDRIWSEKENLTKTLEALTSRRDTVAVGANEKLAGAGQMTKELDNALQHYNASLYKIGITDEALHLQLSDPLQDENLGKSAVELLSGKNIQRSVRPGLISYRHESSTRLHELQNRCIQLQELIDRANESLSEKQESMETLQARLNSDKIAYDELYETMNSDATASNAKIERMDRDIHAMRVTAQQGLLQLEQQCNTIDVTYDQLKAALESSRMHMNSQLTDMINTIVNFKLNIQESLEEHESALPVAQ